MQRALRNQPTLVVLDNLESVLPPAPDAPIQTVYEPEVLEEILALCGRLGDMGRTRLVFTSREALPAPFNTHHITIDRLSRREAIELVGHVLGAGNLMPHTSDPGQSEEEIESLVEAVHCHARSLVLLVGEIVESGVRHATANLHALMLALQEKHPNSRERSLLASIGLSLRRLPAGTSQKIFPLGVFQGGGSLVTIARVLGLDTDKDEVVSLAQQLIGVGLAEALPYNFSALAPSPRSRTAQRADRTGTGDGSSDLGSGDGTTGGILDAAAIAGHQASRDFDTLGIAQSARHAGVSAEDCERRARRCFRH